jgi:hypothetical protein
VHCLSLGQLIIVEMVKTVLTVEEQHTFHMLVDEMTRECNLTQGK